MNVFEIANRTDSSIEIVEVVRDDTNGDPTFFDSLFNRPTPLDKSIILRKAFEKTDSDSLKWNGNLHFR